MVDSKKLLKSEELEAILKLCNRYHVKALKCPGLEVSWEDHIILRDETPVPKAEILAEQTKEQAKAILQAELELKREQIANMLIEDPSRAEELIASGELIEDGDGEDSEEIIG